MINEHQNLECLTREWAVVFTSPDTTRENSVRNFLRHLGITGVREYEYEKLVLTLVSPSGPMMRGQQQPSLLERYRGLSVDEREQFHRLVDQTFAEIKVKHAEAYFDYLKLFDATESIFKS